MDKNIIKNRLSERFLVEAETPGISVTDKVRKESGKHNKDGIKASVTNVKDFDKNMENDANVPQNKFNYNDKTEKEYHDQMEILNGQEMIEYDREPNEAFKDRAKEGIEGSTRMGNKGGKGVGNAEETWGASSDDFGKKLVKNIKASTQKRQDAVKGIISFGDDIETVPKNYAPMSKHSALTENEESSASNDIEQGKPYGTEDEYEFNNSDKANNDKNNKTKIKESMKRLKFNKEFKGVGNALKMIPESYRTDNKEFEMTDGNETYRIRWEGTLSEGKAVVLTASNKTMVNEDMQKMKHLMGYKSETTLGLVKGNARLNENAIFNDIYAKTKALLEGEDIEDQTAPEKKTDEKLPQAKEAKKDIEGSTSDDKGTQAPKAKTTTPEALDDAKKQAPEAKKHVEGSVDAKIGMGLGEKAPEGEWDQIDVPQGAAHGNPSNTTYAPSPSTGEWDKINVPQATDAKKHITMGEGLELGGQVFTPMTEEVEEMEDLEEGADKSEEKDGKKDKDNKFDKFIDKVGEKIHGGNGLGLTEEE